MKVTVQVQGVHRSAKQAGDHVVVTGKCHHCGAEPFKVRGKGISSNDRDAYYADGHCVACDNFVGTIRAKVDTLFGIEEDERVLAGPWKVY